MGEKERLLTLAEAIAQLKTDGSNYAIREGADCNSVKISISYYGSLHMFWQQSYSGEWFTVNEFLPLEDWKIVENKPKYKEGDIVGICITGNMYSLTRIIGYDYHRDTYEMANCAHKEEFRAGGRLVEIRELDLISLDEFVKLQDAERGE